MDQLDRQTEPIVFVDGTYVPRLHAKISVFDHVVLYGDGIYDTMCSWNHKVFKLDQHIDRLYESANAIKLAIPYPKDQLKTIILETIRRNGLRDAYVKVIVTRGTGAQPLLTPNGCIPSVIAFAVPYLSLAQGKQDAGLQAIVSSMRRIPNECTSTKIKSCNYLNHVLMSLEASDRGADAAIELDLDGYVCEAPGYNVFSVKRGKLTTPAENILVGITRQTVIEIAEALSIPVTVGRLQVFDLYNSDEVFLSSTAGGVVSVVRLDGRLIGTGKPGPIATNIRHRYEGLLESGEKSTPVHWGTEVVG